MPFILTVVHLGFVGDVNRTVVAGEAVVVCADIVNTIPLSFARFTSDRFNVTTRDESATGMGISNERDRVNVCGTWYCVIMTWVPVLSQFLSTAGKDYTEVFGIFSPSSGKKCWTLQTLDNDKAQSSRYFTFSFASGQGDMNTVIQPSSVTVTITDDDCEIVASYHLADQALTKFDWFVCTPSLPRVIVPITVNLSWLSKDFDCVTNAVLPRRQSAVVTLCTQQSKLFHCYYK